MQTPPWLMSPPQARSEDMDSLPASPSSSTWGSDEGEASPLKHLLLVVLLLPLPMFKMSFLSCLLTHVLCLLFLAIGTGDSEVSAASLLCAQDSLGLLPVHYAASYGYANPLEQFCECWV